MVNKLNKVLQNMIVQIEQNRTEILKINSQDVALCSKADIALYDRLILQDKNLDAMIQSLKNVILKEVPFGKSIYSYRHDNGLLIENKTVPFGTVLIIYESRPDVTVEATAIALKSGNKILLKGGKEARKTNLFLHQCWLNALELSDMDNNWIVYLDLNRHKFQEFLEDSSNSIDLIIPRGGIALLEYVQKIARCPVITSGRGNNFLYISEEGDLQMAKKIIIASKISKISACNALDKVLINKKISNIFKEELLEVLRNEGVEVIEEANDTLLCEEFLDLKILVLRVKDMMTAINMINKFSGRHSATIITKNANEAQQFFELVDCAAVYHNASTRFTDGFQFGLGAEMAISTSKLHHRGPLGIEHLVTNKWQIKGHGQVR